MDDGTTAALAMLLGPPLIYALAHTGLLMLPVVIDTIFEPEKEEEQDIDEPMRGKPRASRKDASIRPSRTDKRLQELNDLAEVSSGGKVVKKDRVYLFQIGGKTVMEAGTAEEMRAKILGFCAASRKN